MKLASAEEYKMNQERIVCFFFSFCFQCHQNFLSFCVSSDFLFFLFSELFTFSFIVLLSFDFLMKSWVMYRDIKIGVVKFYHQSHQMSRVAIRVIASLWNSTVFFLTLQAWYLLDSYHWISDFQSFLFRKSLIEISNIPIVMPIMFSIFQNYSSFR